MNKRVLAFFMIQRDPRRSTGIQLLVESKLSRNLDFRSPSRVTTQVLAGNGCPSGFAGNGGRDLACRFA